MPGIFDSINFNAEVFAAYVDRTPNLNRNELIRSRAVRERSDLAVKFSEQVGGNFAVVPMFGSIGGDALNYDGVTDITATGSETYTQGRIVVGRAKAWVEKDFSYDITGGVDFLEQAASQVGEYWDNIDQGLILSTLNGIFAMTGAENLKFVEGHTLDISGAAGDAANFNATTLNSGMQKALGDNKAKFSLAIMHSAVATNLENLNLLDYLKYTDAQGIQRPLAIGTLNGRTVLVDDAMPTGQIPTAYEKTSDVALDPDKTYYTRSGSSPNYVYTPVATPDVSDIGTYYEVTASDTSYTTYVLGDGAIEYTNCGAKVPYETSRDPAKNGGQDTLYSRQRKIYAPVGISWRNSSAIMSPTNAQLENGANWEIANSNTSTKKYFPHKAIPIARVISKG